MPPPNYEQNYQQNYPDSSSQMPQNYPPNYQRRDQMLDLNYQQPPKRVHLIILQMIQTYSFHKVHFNRHHRMHMEALLP